MMGWKLSDIGNVSYLVISYPFVMPECVNHTE